MKYISLLFIMIILAACLSPSGDQSAPQVTVTLTATSIPTTTPIPTPTTHPQVMAIREQIAQSADFTLNADGQIEMQTEEGMTIVPDIQVQPDGRMTFTHNGQEFTANTETLEIDEQTIRFKDTEGKTWVWDGESLKEAESEAVKQAKADFEKYGYSTEGLEFVEDENGVRAIDHETEKMVYMNGEFSLEFAVFNATDLIPTNYEPKDESLVGVPNRPTELATSEYIFPIVQKVRSQMVEMLGVDPGKTKNMYLPLMLDPEILAYGGVYDLDATSPGQEFLFYENSDENLVIVPVLQGSFGEALTFWVGKN